MLSKHNSIQREQIDMIALDQLIPANHLVRKIKNLKRDSECFTFRIPFVDNLRLFLLNSLFFVYARRDRFNKSFGL